MRVFVLAAVAVALATAVLLDVAGAECLGSTPCFGHGTCVGGTTCDCDPGYVGNNCFMPVSPLAPYDLPASPTGLPFTVNALQRSEQSDPLNRGSVVELKDDGTHEVYDFGYLRYSYGRRWTFIAGDYFITLSRLSSSGTGVGADDRMFAKFHIPTETWSAIDTVLGFSCGNVRAAVQNGTDIYIGGNNWCASDPAYKFAVRLDTATMTFYPITPGGFSPSSFNYVYAMEIVGDTLYIGGSFSSAGGNFQIYGLAAYHPATDTLSPVTTMAGSRRVYSLHYHAPFLFACGNFEAFGGDTAARFSNFAAINLETMVVSGENELNNGIPAFSEYAYCDGGGDGVMIVWQGGIQVLYNAASRQFEIDASDSIGTGGYLEFDSVWGTDEYLYVYDDVIDIVWRIASFETGQEVLFSTGNLYLNYGFGFIDGLIITASNFAQFERVGGFGFAISDGSGEATPLLPPASSSTRAPEGIYPINEDEVLIYSRQEITDNFGSTCSGFMLLNFGFGYRCVISGQQQGYNPVYQATISDDGRVWLCGDSIPTSDDSHGLVYLDPSVLPLRLVGVEAVGSVARGCAAQGEWIYVATNNYPYAGRVNITSETRESFYSSYIYSSNPMLVFAMPNGRIYYVGSMYGVSGCPGGTTACKYAWYYDDVAGTVSPAAGITLNSNIGYACASGDDIYVSGLFSNAGYAVLRLDTTTDTWMPTSAAFTSTESGRLLCGNGNAYYNNNDNVGTSGGAPFQGSYRVTSYDGNDWDWAFQSFTLPGGAAIPTTSTVTHAPKSTAVFDLVGDWVAGEVRTIDLTTYSVWGQVVDNRDNDTFWLSANSLAPAANWSVEAPGLYRQPFTMTLAGTHALSVMGNGRHIAGSPMEVTVVPAAASVANTVFYEGYFAATVTDGSNSFLIEVRDAYDNVRATADTVTVVFVSGPTGVTLPVVAVANELPGVYRATFDNMTVAGEYQYSVLVNAASHPSNPFSLTLSAEGTDARSSYAVGLGDGLVGVQQNFSVVSVDRFGNPMAVGGADFDFEMTLDDISVGTVVSDLGNGNYSLSYYTLDGGLYLLSVRLDGVNIIGSPFQITVLTQCPLGQFAETPSGPCAPCQVGRYSEQINVPECEACPAATTSPIQSTSAMNCSCAKGYFTSEGPGVECDPCPAGGNCTGGLVPPFAAPGYFPNPSDPYAFIPCVPAEACPGGFPFECAPSYTGRLCADCATGYYELVTFCYECSNSGSGLMVLFFLALFLFCAVLVWFNSSERAINRFATLVIGINSIQISAIYGELKLDWPGLARRFFDVLSIANLNIELASPECSFTTFNPFLFKWGATLAMPLLVIPLFGLAYLCGLGYIHLVRRCGDGFKEKHPEFCEEPLFPTCRNNCRYRCSRLCWESKLTPKSLRHTVVRSWYQILSFAYLPLAAMTLRFFDCVETEEGDGSVLESSAAFKCYTPQYWRVFPVAVLATIAWVIGIPVFLTQLLRYKRRTLESFKFQLRYGFLVARFKDDYYLYEMLVLGRKLGVVICMLFISQNEYVRASFAAGVLFVAYVFHARYYPFVTKLHNWVEASSLVSAIVVLFCGVGFAGSDVVNSKISATIIVVALVGNISFIIVALVLDFRRLNAEEAAEDEEAADRMEMAMYGARPIAKAVGYVGDVSDGSEASSAQVHNINPIFGEEEDDSDLGFATLSTRHGSNASLFGTRRAPDMPPPPTPTALVETMVDDGFSAGTDPDNSSTGYGGGYGAGGGGGGHQVVMETMVENPFAAAFDDATAGMSSSGIPDMPPPPLPSAVQRLNNNPKRMSGPAIPQRRATATGRGGSGLSGGARRATSPKTKPAKPKRLR